MDPTYLLLILAPLALLGLAGGGGDGGGGGGGSDDDEPEPQITDGDDEVSGTTGNDLLNLGDGDDVIFSVFFDGETAGNDIVRGEGGDDVLFDPDGSNQLDGGDGDDIVVGFDREGAEGSDLLIGGDGDDRIYADDGDTVRAGDGRDVISIVTDFDADPVTIEGYGENDEFDAVRIFLPSGTFPEGTGGGTLPEGFESDFVQNGDDVEFTLDGQTLAIFKDISAEALREAVGFDDGDPRSGRLLVENTPDNIPIPDAYLETIQLEDGGDFFRAAGLGGSGFDIRGGDGDDQIDNLSFGDDFVRGGDGDDSISGSSGDDTLFGEAGDDRLSGGNGDDELRGGAGNDSITGGSEGVDLLNGGDGDDNLASADRASDYADMDKDTINYADRLQGGAGDDRLSGDDGDLLNGGSGADTFFISQRGFAEELGIEYEPAIVQDFNPAEDSLEISDRTLDLTNDDVELRQNGSDVEVTANGFVYAVLKNVTVADLDGITIEAR